MEWVNSDRSSLESRKECLECFTLQWFWWGQVKLIASMEVSLCEISKSSCDLTVESCVKFAISRLRSERRSRRRDVSHYGSWRNLHWRTTLSVGMFISWLRVRWGSLNYDWLVVRFDGLEMLCREDAVEENVVNLLKASICVWVWLGPDFSHSWR